ncbi:MAG: response regulator [Chitinophagales bacterium]
MTEPLILLLVEDDPDDIELFKELLSSHHVEHHLNVIIRGDEVLPYLEKCTTLPTEIILDLNLPKMHGKEVLKALKRHPRFHQIPVIILTTSAAKKDVEDCLNSGAEKFLTKPTNTSGFKNMIDAVVKVGQQLRC